MSEGFFQGGNSSETPKLREKHFSAKMLIEKIPSFKTPRGTNPPLLPPP